MYEQGIVDSLRCDFSTGKVYWKNVNKYHNEKNGKEAGCISYGRCIIKLNGKIIKRSHVVYFLANGKLPSNGVIDHINRNPLDDRPENLREVSVTTNNRNHSRRNIRKLKNGYQVRLGNVFSKNVRTLSEAVKLYDTKREEIWKT